jgi:glucosamine--fructose-6-phosphate aminotransferase (isomerizing)
MPVVVLPKQGHYDKIVSNIQEIKSGSGRIIAIVKGDTEVRKLALRY